MDGGWGEYLEGLIMLPVSALEKNFNPRVSKTAGAKTCPSPVQKGLPAENPQQQLMFQEPVEEAAYTPTPTPPSPKSSLFSQQKRSKNKSNNSKNLKQNVNNHVNNLPSTEQAAKTQPKQDKSFSFIFPRFRPFICC